MHGNFMSFTMCFLYGRVIGVFVWDEECCLDVTAVGIFASFEHLFIEIDIIVIDGIIKRHCNHHGNILGRQVSRNGRSVFRAEAIGQHTNHRIAWWGTVGIIVNIYSKSKYFKNQSKTEGNGVGGSVLLLETRTF